MPWRGPVPTQGVTPPGEPLIDLPDNRPGPDADGPAALPEASATTNVSRPLRRHRLGLPPDSGNAAGGSGQDKHGGSDEAEGVVDGCSRKWSRFRSETSKLDGIRFGAHVGACFAVRLHLGDQTAVARLSDSHRIAFTV